MLPLKLAGGICLSALALAASSAAQKTINSFKPIATVGVPNGVAEIVDATDDGMKLLYSDSSASNIGVVDLTTPSAPKLLGTVPVSGEPTSVSILGNYAVATVWADLKEEGKPAPKFTAGKLYVMDLSGSGLPKVLGTIDLGWHPDSVKLTKIGNDLVAVVAIENEPCILDGNNLVTDDDIPGHPNDVSPAGFIQVVTIDTANLANSTVAKVDLTSATLQAAGCQFENDPQPEFVVTHGTTAAVTLQENNGVAIVDIATPTSPKLVRVFSTGVAAERITDLTEDEQILFAEGYPSSLASTNRLPKDGADRTLPGGLRCADALTFTPDGQFVVTADEGELNFTGGRGISMWKLDGTLAWQDGGLLEYIAGLIGQFPEGRAENKGIEMEGITSARFGNQDFVFAMSERGSWMAVFQLKNGVLEFEQVVATGISPEGVVAIPSRGLVVTSEEESGTLTVFEASSESFVPPATSPLLFTPDILGPFAAISGLAMSPESNDWLFAIPDNALPSRVYALQMGNGLAPVWTVLPMLKDNQFANYDGEGIVADTSVVAPFFFAGFWFAAEGDAKSDPNLLVQMTSTGRVLKEIQLPSNIDAAADASLPGKATGAANNAMIRSNGFEGVTVSADGRYLITVIQRDFKDEFTGDRYARIARYDLEQIRDPQNAAKISKGLRYGGDWDFFFYKLESNDPDNWAGLSEVTTIGAQQYAVIERDKEIGDASKLKKIFAFSLKGLTPDTDGKPDATDTVKKFEAYDILQDFFPYEKVEGMTISKNGDLWISLDNDGGEVENRILNKGPFKNPIK
jgi:hypothetical protein